MLLPKMLKNLLAEGDVTVAHLSRATKVPRQTIDNWLSGQEPGSISQLKRVADYFDVSLDYLCFGTTCREKSLVDFEDEINAGIFEVVLRRPRGQ